MKLLKQQKQVIVLYATTALGVLVGILSSVINTRALPPDLFGNVRYVQNIISFVSSLLLVGFFVSGSRLLALSKSEEYSRRIRGIMCVILAITIGVVMLSMLVMYIYTRIKGENPGMPSLYLVAIPLCGTVLMLNYVNTTAQGDNHIGRIAVARLLPTSIYVVVAFFIYKKFGATPELMLWLYNGIATIVLVLVILSTKPSFTNLRESFVLLNEENRHYGFNVYLGSLADNATGYVAGITLGFFCDTNSSVGFYTLAQTMASPLAMLPAIIGTTYFKRFASEKCISRKVLFSSVFLTILSCIVFVFLIKYVVMFLYNEDYYQVATYSSWLAIASCMHGLGDMFNRYLGSQGQGKQLRNSSFAAGGVLLVGSIVLVYFFRINGAIMTKILSSLVYLLMLCFYYIQFVKKQTCKNTASTIEIP